MYRVDRLVVCGAQADSRVGDSSGHLVSSRRYVNERCQSVSRGVGSPTQSHRDSQLGAQGRATADVDGECGSACGRRESDPHQRRRLLAVRCCRSPNERNIAFSAVSGDDETDDAMVSVRTASAISVRWRRISRR